MTKKTGMAQRIAAYVAAHPGCTRAQLVAGCGITNPDDAMPTYCRNAGLIFAAGPRGSTRYYPDAEQAYKAHPGLVADAQRRRDEVKRRAWLEANERDKVRRLQDRPQVLAQIAARARVRADAKRLVGPDVAVPRTVRIVIAPPMRDRWAA